eukprot:TRINITY_DN3350_c0_g1_i2.p1 TRINITY_DN3350_c0_g1~~TRINITY_DN3350_c0_g1_i2.p1  ORF type:complete len:373 (-),score=35.43 TRINITY_DN3350_c0_g1_i2:298-1416(-)
MNSYDFDDRLFFTDQLRLVSSELSDRTIPAMQKTHTDNNTTSVLHWLRQLLSEQKLEPSQILEHHFRSCSINPIDEIRNRTNKVSFLLADWDADLISTAIKLYYNLLETILVAEVKRLGHTNFNTLLHHDKFHLGLLACAIIIVVICYQMDMSFSVVLRKLDLAPFDFCKTLCNAFLLRPSPPRLVTAHLCKIEESILESLSWEVDSPLFSHIDESQQTILADRLKESGTPKKLSQSPCSIFCTPQKVINVDETVNKRMINLSVELFLRKVSLLASHRIRTLCQDLKLNEITAKQVEYAFIYIITQKSDLIKNRHIDQIIMCIIYAIARVNDIQGVSFKSITEKYLNQPHASRQRHFLWNFWILSSLKAKRE